MHERAEFVGWDARTAGERRQQQAQREEARRQACAWASAAYDHAGDRPHSWARDAGRV